MRVFVGLELSAGFRAALASVLADLDVPGRPTSPETWHITLRYIGEMDDVSIDRLLAGLDECDLGLQFRLVTGGLGAFPNPSKATVLWVGFRAGVEPLADLAATVDEVVDRIGLGQEDRPFAAHLTLSRIRPPLDVRGLVSDFNLPSIALPVTGVTVFESRHDGRGVQYRSIERFSI